MPNISVVVGVFDSLDDGFGRIILIGTQNHHDFIGFVEDDVFGDHLG